MELLSQHLVFTLDEQRYAIALSSVEKVIRAVALVSVPKAPDILHGLINMQGKITPVVNIRKQFRLPGREMGINDRIIVSRTSIRTIAFIVDNVEGVVAFPRDQVDNAQEIFPEMEHYMEGVAKLDDNTILIYSLDKLFSTQDVNGLDKVIDEQI